MEQDRILSPKANNSALCNDHSHSSVKIALGCALLFGGVAAWIASNTVHQAFHRALLDLSVSELVIRITGILSLGSCAFAMILIGALMAITAVMQLFGVQLLWSKRSLPELAHLARKECSRAYNACQFNIFREWQTWAILTVIIFASAVGCYFIFPLPEPHAFIITGLLGGSAGGVISQLFMRRTRRHLREKYDTTSSTV